MGLTQEPYFFYEGAGFRDGPEPARWTTSSSIRRLVLRQASFISAYPFSRFRRFEFGAGLVNVEDDAGSSPSRSTRVTGVPTRSPFVETISGPNITFVQPSVALVFDNSLYGPVGPMMGRRSRFEVSRTLGDGGSRRSISTTAATTGSPAGVTFATRLKYFGRHGRDEGQFRFFAGRPEFIRGYTSGSFAKNECANVVDQNTFTGCAVLDELVGTRMLLATAELPLPAAGASWASPVGVPRLLEGVRCSTMRG